MIFYEEEIVPTLRFVHSLRLIFLLIPLIIFSACSSTYQGDEFTFSAPFGFKTKQYEIPEIKPNNDSQLLIFSQKGHLYFQVFREKIPPESDLDMVFAEYLARTVTRPSNMCTGSAVESLMCKGGRSGWKKVAGPIHWFAPIQRIPHLV
jgi:thioredoxin-related protein